MDYIIDFPRYKPRVKFRRDMEAYICQGWANDGYHLLTTSGPSICWVYVAWEALVLAQARGLDI